MKKGFTLIEVITSIAIMAVVGIFITTIYVTITKYGGKRNETNNIKLVLNNIHESYLNDPENWESNYFDLYDLDFSQTDYQEQVIYYKNGFQEVSFTETTLRIFYEYIGPISEDNNKYSLTILKIMRNETELDKEIYLGEWIKRTP